MKNDQRQLLWIKEGATISNNGRDYVIVALADVNLVLAKEFGSDVKVLLKIGDIGPPKVIGEVSAEPAPVYLDDVALQAPPFARVRGDAVGYPRPADHARESLVRGEADRRAPSSRSVIRMVGRGSRAQVGRGMEMQGGTV
jgi:hypothetical protein